MSLNNYNGGISEETSIINDLSKFFERSAKKRDKRKYRKMVQIGRTTILTGIAPVWMYLSVMDEISRVREQTGNPVKLILRTPKDGDFVVFNDGR